MKQNFTELPNQFALISGEIKIIVFLWNPFGTSPLGLENSKELIFV